MISSARQPKTEMLHFRGAGNNKPYTFSSSRPQALSVRAQLDRDYMCRQMDYTNIVHNKLVDRGSEFAKKLSLGKESHAAQAEARRRAMARKKAIYNETRAMRLHLGPPKFPKGRQNMDIQTDVHLEELYEYPVVSQTCGLQVELVEEVFSNPGIEKPPGTDASTQVDDKEFLDFETEVTRVAEALVSRELAQAMDEVLYEEELESRARQQRALCMQRKVEEIEMQRLKYQDERLKEIIAEHTQMFCEGVRKEKERRSSMLTSGRVSLISRIN